MELVFIASAIRRYLWVVLFCAAIGVAPALLSGGGVPEYQSRGVLLVVPPVDGPAAYVGDPDRYVVGQLSVLRSTSLAERVAVALERDDPAAIAATVSFDHESSTDLVFVTAKTPDAALSQALVNAYLDAYLLLIDEQSSLEPFTTEIAEVEEQLDEVNAQIRTAMEPYLLAQPTPAGEAVRPIPNVDQVAPSLASQQTLLVNTLVDLRQELSRLETIRRSRLGGVVPQRGTLPSAPVSSRSPLLVVAGGVAGGSVGVLGALLAARLSPRVLDNVHAEEILGAPVLGTVPHEPRLVDRPRAALELLPVSVASFVDALRVRVEAAAGSGESLAVAVVGTRLGAGSTTLALALGARSARGGARVLLVDADAQRPELSATFAPYSPRGVDAAADEGAGPLGVLSVATATSVAGVTVASFGRNLGSSTLRRRHVGEAIAEARAHADVVIFDGGPLMSSSSTVELARACDVVVLVVPAHARVRSLVEVAGELRDRPFLPVWTRTARSSTRRLLDRILRRTRDPKVRPRTGDDVTPQPVGSGEGKGKGKSAGNPAVRRDRELTPRR